MSISDTALDALVGDYLRWEVPSPTRRDLDLPLLPSRADAVIGVRRGGKTWFLFQRMRDLLAAGVPRERLLYVNFEDDRLLPLGRDDPARILDAWFRRHPEIRAAECHLFLDEVYLAPEWSRFVRRVLDGGGVRVAFSGSSAKLLSTEIATNMRGRSLSTEVLPFSFRERLRHVGDPGEPGPRAASSAVRSAMERAFADHLECGGFPDVQRLDAVTRLSVLREQVDVTLFRDVVERHGISNVTALRRLVRHLLRHPATRFSVQKFHRDLGSQGVAVGRDALHAMLDHLSDARFVFPVEIETESERGRTRNPRKCYLVDHALHGVAATRTAADTGLLLENAVRMELHRRRWDVTYYLTADGREVDFAARHVDGRERFVQVCADVSDAATRTRELAALEKAMLERPGRGAVVVNLLRDDEVKLAGREVPIVPAWRWFLDAEG